MARTGASGSSDLPLPQNVRMYDVTGAAHLNVRQQNKACREPHGQLDWPSALRAPLIVLDEWVHRGTAPPASLLMPLEARPDPTALPVPSYLPQATIMLPKLDADGNALDGLRLPDIEVPIATYGNLNAPLTHVECRLVGTYRPFAKTAAERQVVGDPRASLQERYPGGINEYTSKVRMAVKELVVRRLLLEEDGVIIVHAAAETPSFQPTPPRSRWSTGGPHFKPFVLLIVSLIFGCSCSLQLQSFQMNSPQMRVDDVIQIANTAAQDADYNLSEFSEPKAHFEFDNKD